MLRRRSLLLAGADARHLLLRLASLDPAVSRHRSSSRRHVAFGSLAHLRPAHGRGRRSCSGTHHAAAHPAHHPRRADRRASEKPAAAKHGSATPLAHRARPLPGRRHRRLRAPDRPAVFSSSVQARSRRAGGRARESRRLSARRRLRIPLRHRLGAHRRHRRLLRIARLRHDDRHTDGHRSHLPREGLDRTGLRRARHHHRRHRLHRRLERGRHRAGPEDRLPIGATPWKQQLAIMIGVIISIFSIGTTLNAMNKGLESFQRVAKPIAILARPPPGWRAEPGQLHPRPHLAHRPSEQSGDRTSKTHQHEAVHPAQRHRLHHPRRTASISTTPPPARSKSSGSQGIGSEKAAAPQGRLMATVINGILSRKLPWSLVLLGVALVIVVELLGIRSLTFAVGAYLSIATTLAIFVGGVMRWMVDRAMRRYAARQAQIDHDASLALWHSDRETWLVQHPDFDPATVAATPTPAAVHCSARSLLAMSRSSPKSHLAASMRQVLSPQAESLVFSGSAFACWRAFRNSVEVTGSSGAFSDHNPLHQDWVSVIMFGLLAFSLYHFARKPLKMEG